MVLRVTTHISNKRLMNPLISIVIPVANGAEFLWESLTSVIHQTYTQWECWIALNGEGLKGPAAAVATAIAGEDPRIHVLPQPPTIHSKVAALNHVLPFTKGEWIALLDVDDRWALTKLAEQVAALGATGALVIGTGARYFGEFSGAPAIPSGFVSTEALCEGNPIINSSALIHRKVCCKNSWRKLKSDANFRNDAIFNFSYHSTVPSALEDYFFWMQVALMNHSGGQAAFYNVPRCLVDHRIHGASAFNSRADSPAPLQAWYREQLATSLAMPLQPIRILTTVCGSPHFIRAQVAAFRRCLGVPWEFVVFNDAKDWPDATNFGDATMRQQVEETCRELGIRCIPVANQGHRHQPSASHRHCETLRHVMEFVRKEPALHWMIDSDMWPVAFMGPADVAAMFKGAGTFVKQSRQGPGGEITYAWPNLWWLDTTRVDSSNLCWDLAPHCDTGGASFTWVSRHAVQWLPPHLSSGRWGLKDLPKYLHANHALVEFLTQDPRNSEDGCWAELYGPLFHVRAGSNWNGEGVAVHQQIAALTKSFFS